MKCRGRHAPVARSNLIERELRPTKPRDAIARPDQPMMVYPSACRRAAELWIPAHHRLVNREQRAEGASHDQCQASAADHAGQRSCFNPAPPIGLPGTHEGVVIALRSNIRWCSDHLELTCRNGDIVRILFVIDACDREIIAWSAVAHAGVSGEMVRDLMIEAVERRFAGTRTPHPVEWLSDNGSAYIAKETATTATASVLKLAFNPGAFARKQRHLGSLQLGTADPYVRLRDEVARPTLRVRGAPFGEVLAGFDARLDTPPSINRRHPDSSLALFGVGCSASHTLDQAFKGVERAD